ncbi:MAG TPA: hypothetical protein VGA78_11095 [Gemmatimonadales bacterium]|jgi:hypothetical protein
MQQQAYDAGTVEVVWRKGREIPGLPSSIWRRDRFGATIRRFDYGTESDYGWVVDQRPAFLGIGLTMERLQPLQWRNATPDLSDSW